MPHSLTLILFDIDGTLLDTKGAGRRSFGAALEQAFGWGREADSIEFAGATDLDLLARIAKRRGRLLSEEEICGFFALLPESLGVELRNEPPHVHPGVRELLAALTERPDVRLGLVTGNVESCARLKLESCGLHGHFELGAYGHEHADRREIALLAARRAERALTDDERFRSRILIGDTPSDIAAAHSIGAKAWAVATGGFSADRLREAGADLILESLRDADALVHLV